MKVTARIDVMDHVEEQKEDMWTEETQNGYLRILSSGM